jgi:hypothetical protein
MAAGLKEGGGGDGRRSTYRISPLLLSVILLMGAAIAVPLPNGPAVCVTSSGELPGPTTTTAAAYKSGGVPPGAAIATSASGPDGCPKGTAAFTAMGVNIYDIL